MCRASEYLEVDDVDIQDYMCGVEDSYVGRAKALESIARVLIR